MTTLGTTTVKTLLLKSKIPGFDYTINPYVGCPHKCVYCYAEYMRKLSGHAEEWGDFLDVKECPAPTHPAKLFHTRVMLSSVTDPYNRYEEQFRLTRNILTQLRFAQAEVCIYTKSPLVLRDIDLLKEMWKAEVCFSFSTADETFRQLAEPGAPSLQERINALRVLHENNIPTAVMIAPIFPEITDWEKIIHLTRPFTNRYAFDSLNMRPGYQKKVISFVEKNYPQHLPVYCDIYLEEKTAYWDNLAQKIKEVCQKHQIEPDICFQKNQPFMP